MEETKNENECNPEEMNNLTVKSKFDFRKCMTTQNKIIVCFVIAAIGAVVLY